MLVAYGPDGKLVIAGETPLERVQSWSRGQALRCPSCRGIVYARGGPEKRAQLHFAHQKGECAWSTEAESVRHMRGKVVLADWLREQFPLARVTLEERLPEPNRIADIFVTYPDGQRQAIEFQCAPLDLDEWKHRHEAYRKAGIVDSWIIGNNRREKQEAFIEAIIAMAHEALFLDPLTNPPRIWLRWPVTREIARVWQAEASLKPLFEGWVGHLGYGVSLTGKLQDVRLEKAGVLSNAARATLETRARLLDQMRVVHAVDEVLLKAYLLPAVGEAALHDVIMPVMRAFLRDPDLLRRYNYGRGQWHQSLDTQDQQRVQKARAWLEKIALQGYTPARLQELANEIPLVGPFAAFAGYVRMLAVVI
ncbi:MAG TPA: competence protein CoiA family protein [Ktedonobacteraceae bacterium]|nr:competence protein CoiA family protein [Ktedonobacteraceae bacterium]